MLTQRNSSEIATMDMAQPDVTLHLSLEGVIEDVVLSNTLPGERVDDWIGRSWTETVNDVGGDKIKLLVEHAKHSGVSAFRQLTQRFPSGLEIPMEYAAIRLSENAGLVAIGKSLETVAELQSKLISAQQAMEREYWRYRDIETRYRLLFDASNEVVLVIRASNFHVIEANPAAIRALGFAPGGRDLRLELPSDERDRFETMLETVREQGKSPRSIFHLGHNSDTWLVSASLMTAEHGAVFLLQLTPFGLTPVDSSAETVVSIRKLMDRAPDGFVAIDADGVIAEVNQTFLDLIQIPNEQMVRGERLGRWLGRPGADLGVLLSRIRSHGAVRLFPTSVHGELGMETEAEVSAVGDRDTHAKYVGLWVRDVKQRLGNTSIDNNSTSLIGSLSDQIGKTPLRRLVKTTTELIEKHYIETALEVTGGNRTAAAALLGLSRQGLYAKLSRYKLDESSS